MGELLSGSAVMDSQDGYSEQAATAQAEVYFRETLDPRLAEIVKAALSNDIDPAAFSS